MGKTVGRAVWFIRVARHRVLVRQEAILGSKSQGREGVNRSNPKNPEADGDFVPHAPKGNKLWSSGGPKSSGRREECKGHNPKLTPCSFQGQGKGGRQSEDAKDEGPSEEAWPQFSHLHDRVQLPQVH